MIRILRTFILVMGLMSGYLTTGFAQCPTTTYPLCTGESYTLTAQVGLTNIQWQIDNGTGYTNVSGAINAVYVASTVGKYRYTAKDANGCDISLCCPFDIVVGTNCPTPCPTTTYSLCTGESYTLTAQAGLTNIQWQIDNGTGYTNISSAINAVYVASTVGKYRYTAKDANGCDISLCCPFDIVVGTNCPTTCPTTTYSLCTGESYTLTAQAGLTNIQWQIDNGTGYTNISGAINAVYVASTVGKYRYTAKDANGCDISLCCPFDIVVGTNCPTTCPTTTYSLCTGESYTLTAQAGLTNIQWQIDNGTGYTNISSAINAVYVASTVGKYRYTAKDANGCDISLCCPFDIVAGTTPSVPSVSSPQMNSCPSKTVNLSSLSAGLSISNNTYEWHTTNSSASSLVSNSTAAGAGTYYLFSKAIGGCYSQGTPVTVAIQACCAPMICLPITIVRR